MSFNPASILNLSDDAVAAEVSGEIVLISISNGRYFGLDSIGSDIWRRIEGGKSLEALCDELCDSYDGDAATIRQETQALVETLLGRGLLTQAD
ncbi:MAG: PqqD family protein [Sphingomonadales bacterium]|nr:MAG: PqqD family protein [Sphingomonadales bacterium]